MGKDNYFFGQNTLGQVLKLIPKKLITDSAIKFKSDFSTKKFDTVTHLYMMCYAVLGDLTGLRYVCDGMLALGEKLNHLGINYIAPKSTFSDGNKNRDAEVFGEIYQRIYTHYRNFLSDSSTVEPLLRKAYAIDSTTMSLFKAILKASGRKSKDGPERGGIKSHIQIRLIDEMPMNNKFSAGASSDHEFLKELILEKDDIAIFDKAYVDYEQYDEWSNKGIGFVTREKDNAVSVTTSERDLPDDKDYEIILDEEAEYKYKDKDNKEQTLKLRRVTVYSEKHDDTIVLLSNLFYLEASEISLLYRKRWRIELLFKQLKQNFPLKYFLGDNENAIKIQIWCCLIVNLLVTIIKLKAKNNKQSFASTVSIIRQHLMSYIDIVKYLNNPDGLRKEFVSKYNFRSKYDRQIVMNFGP